MIAGDVVVYGGTVAGVCAAVAAARTGVRAVLLEPGKHVGGMTSGGLGYTAVVDATYEGDLLAAAGVSFAVGRESRGRHGETFAGRREVMPGRHATPEGISPFRDDQEGLREGALLPQIKAGPMAEVARAPGASCHTATACASRERGTASRSAAGTRTTRATGSSAAASSLARSGAATSSPQVVTSGSSRTSPATRPMATRWDPSP